MHSRRGRLLPALLLCLFCFGLRLYAQASTSDSAILRDLGRYEESRRLALDAIQVNSSDIESYIVLCQDLLALGRFADAENYALKAYAVKRDARLSEILGEAAFNLGRNAAALKHFQNYVAAVPEGANIGVAYYHMGEIYLRLARYAHADIAFTMALQFSPGNAHWWARAGWACEKAGDSKGALDAYRAALAIEPRLDDALLGRDRVQALVRG